MIDYVELSFSIQHIHHERKGSYDLANRLFVAMLLDRLSGLLEVFYTVRLRSSKLSNQLNYLLDFVYAL